ncbi:MAG: cryptochrome/photolyase family protein, partial [Flammeovirgaceae bacterium]|nr:cryptochrome/photolyase family protein [Flammeovirgaceae bacterium]MDW8288385.1 cryptochrome/photolyase family protein [Flammeovirgaceae bacterium]
ASANYIDKMSNYCHQCHYNKKRKTGTNACPFNSLYWHFYHRHRPLLEKNPRIGVMYQQWDRTAPAEKEQILSQAAFYLDHLEEL